MPNVSGHKLITIYTVLSNLATHFRYATTNYFITQNKLFHKTIPANARIRPQIKGSIPIIFYLDTKKCSNYKSKIPIDSKALMMITLLFK